MIQYKIKVYDSKKEFKLDIENEYITSGININLNLNQVSNSLLSLRHKQFFEDNIVLNDYIEIYEYKNKVQQLIFSGFIQELKDKYKSWTRTIQIKSIGIGTLLNYWYFQSETKDEDYTLDDIINIIITDIDLKYQWFIKKGNIGSYTDTIKVELKNKNYIETLQLLSGITGFYFYINQNWYLDMLEKKDIQNYFVIWHNIIDITRTNSLTNMCNYLILTYNGGDTSWLYENIDSINKYWIIAKHITIDEIIDDNTANNYGDIYVNQNWSIKDEYTLQINDKHSYIFDDLINSELKVLNYNKNIENTYIKWINYNNWFISINTEIKNTFKWLINNLINK